MTDARIQHCLIQNGQVLSRAGEAAAVPWWSFTKTVIAAAALSLVRDGQLDLDAPLPQCPYSLRHLLRHESGLPDYGALPAYQQAVAAGETPWPLQEMLERTQADALLHAPGEVFHYSNIGYSQVLRLIEDRLGEPGEAALRRQVLQPLGAIQARMALHKADLVGVEMGHATDYHPGWVYHGLLVGPLRDAAVLLEGLLGTDFLPPPLLQAMLQARSVGGAIADRPWLEPAYGLGLMAGEVQGGLQVVGHTGGGPGSTIAVYRASGMGSKVCAAFAAEENAGRIEAAAISRLA